MKKSLYLILLCAVTLFECKERKTVDPGGIIKEIDVISFTVPGVSQEYIKVGTDVIVINLPENYQGGDFIKPEIRLGKGYKTSSDIVNGFSYEGKKISFSLENTTAPARSYTICVVPFNSIRLTEPAKNYSVTLGPEASITLPATFSGTAQMLNDSGKLVETPTMQITDKITGMNYTGTWGEILNLNGIKEFKIQFPATVTPGEYVANVVWGTKKAVISNQISVKQGALKIRRGTWNMLADDKYFEVSGYNISKDNKYELIIENDYVKNRRITLNYKDAGTLTGSVPADITTGNYKATYLENAKLVEATDPETSIIKYMGEDNFFIRNYSDQPVLKIITQPSKRSNFQSSQGLSLNYYPSVSNINRNERVLVYREKSGPFEEKNDLTLVSRETGKEFILERTADIYPLFDGFMAFYSYVISNDIPSGDYAAYMVLGTKNEKTEKYSQILNIQ